MSFGQEGDRDRGEASIGEIMTKGFSFRGKGAQRKIVQLWRKSDLRLDVADPAQYL